MRIISPLLAKADSTLLASKAAHAAKEHQLWFGWWLTHIGFLLLWTPSNRLPDRLWGTLDGFLIEVPLLPRLPWLLLHQIVSLPLAFELLPLNWGSCSLSSVNHLVVRHGFRKESHLLVRDVRLRLHKTNFQFLLSHSWEVLSDLPVVHLQNWAIVVLNLINSLASEADFNVNAHSFHNSLTNCLKDCQTNGAQPNLPKNLKLFEGAVKSTLPERNEHHGIHVNQNIFEEWRETFPRAHQLVHQSKIVDDVPVSLPFCHQLEHTVYHLCLLLSLEQKPYCSVVSFEPHVHRHHQDLEQWAEHVDIASSVHHCWHLKNIITFYG